MSLPIVLLPGLLCDDTVWVDQRKAFGAGVEVFVPDYGERNSIPAMAEQVLESVHSARFLLAGHSMGGRVALEVARRAPRRVAGLALLDTGYQAREPGDAGEKEKANRMRLLALSREKGMRAMGEQWAPGMVHPARVGSALYGSILDMIERSTPQRFEAQIQALLGRPDAAPMLESLACPTLLICGREDRWSPLARHEDMHAVIPGSKLRVIEDSGHMSTMEQPDAVSAAMLDWIDWALDHETGRTHDA